MFKYAQGGMDIGYSIGQTVMIRSCKIKATVQQVLFNVEGVQYQISFWDDSNRKVEWVFKHEIMPVEQQSVIER